MFRLNRTSEYGLMALRHMSKKSIRDPQEVTSAREISDCYGLPFEITAKTLQRLKDSGLIQSAHGARGGYTLLRALNRISLGEFLELMEGPQSVVACAGSSTANLNPGPQTPIEEPAKTTGCEYGVRCEIHEFMGKVNHQVIQVLSQIQLSDLAEELNSRVVTGRE